MNNQFDESVQLEIESILAIFPKEVFIESNSRIIVEYENNAHLHIRLPLDYPKNPPLFELVSPALSSENRKELLSILNKFCSENNGEQILYSLIQSIEDRKSVFQGHVTKLESKDKVPKLLESLKTVGKIARARHNPYAWRIVNDAERAIEQHDCDDDGETGSASKLLRLLMQMDAKDVLLVVSRWKGGNKIGPDRFRHICNAGRDA
uniref:RWD domain-containing protein n=1 Tax=Meloidogyne javanica TaxID=6303 RepID=A0A915M4J5_MELJA